MSTAGRDSYRFRGLKPTVVTVQVRAIVGVGLHYGRVVDANFIYSRLPKTDDIRWAVTYSTAASHFGSR